MNTEKLTHEDGRIFRLPIRQMKQIIKLIETLEAMNQISITGR